MAEDDKEMTMVERAASQIGFPYADGDGLYVDRHKADTVVREVLDSIRTLDPAIAAVASANWTLSPEQVARLHAQIIDAILQHEETA